jgi:tRNA (guanine37-N1)-methyltransferase
MFFEIVTLFPAMFDGVFSDSIVKRAVEKGLVAIRFVNFRDFADDKHKTVDDYPYGGDPGMLIKPRPLSAAIQGCKDRLSDLSPKVVLLSPQGRLLDHALAQELASEKALILVCGHYKGIDQRVIDRYVDREVSIGDYVLSGGEIPAMALVDAVTRLIPGALGNSESAGKDSFYSGLLSPPQYTRPEEFEGMRVPQVLLSGHHDNIRQWQLRQSIERTREKRPDLWERYDKKSNRETEQLSNKETK